MADAKAGDNAMDYAEHRKTYVGFVKMMKWGTIYCSCLLIGMALSFFGFGGGMITAIFLTVILCVICYFLFKGWVDESEENLDL